jgi:hypothetical protein
MLEFAHAHINIIVPIFTYLAGGATAAAAIIIHVIKQDVLKWLPEPPKHRHTMDVEADRDAIAVAIGLV